MTAKIIPFVELQNDLQRDAKAVLLETAEEGLSSVIIIGIRSNTNIVLRSSKCASVIELLGSIELARDHVLRGPQE